LLWGAYHFADAQSAQAQVDHFMTCATPDDNTLMALDFEPNGGNTMSLNSARQFLEALDVALGRKAVLYSGNLIKETLANQQDEFFGGHRLWLAQYGPVARVPVAWKNYWLWQFSGDGVNNPGITIPGVNPAQAKRLDMNAYDGDDDQLAAEWSGLLPVVPVA
jgi:GH25 family lysozyme M1 (1,4-beta-N-acetylmuramidase)